MVFTVAEPLTEESPTDVAVTVAVLTSPSLAPPGTVTLTQTSVLAPGETLGVVVCGAVQVELRNPTVYVPPEDDRLYVSEVKPRFFTWTM